MFAMEPISVVLRVLNETECVSIEHKEFFFIIYNLFCNTVLYRILKNFFSYTNDEKSDDDVIVSRGGKGYFWF